MKRQRRSRSTVEADEDHESKSCKSTMSKDNYIKQRFSEDLHLYDYDHYVARQFTNIIERRSRSIFTEDARNIQGVPMNIIEVEICSREINWEETRIRSTTINTRISSSIQMTQKERATFRVLELSSVRKMFDKMFGNCLGNKLIARFTDSEKDDRIWNETVSSENQEWFIYSPSGDNDIGWRRGVADHVILRRWRHVASPEITRGNFNL